MLKLLKKEFVLAMHPITPMMLLLSAMVLIPNYPYTVIFFYVSMAIFFTCLLGRENNDVIYSLNLPIAKKNIVKSRFAYTIILQFFQLAIMIPFAIINAKINPIGNQAGMDANIALFGLGFIVYGLFNLVFFHGYYLNINKVGISFVKSSIVISIIACLDVVSTYAIPFVKDFLDTQGTAFLSYKLAFLALSIVLYLILTFFSYSLSVKNFLKQDLN